MSGSALPTTAVEITAAVKAGDVTAVETAEAALAAIEAGDGDVAAFVHVDRDAVLGHATRVDAKRAAGERLGPLAGVPVAIKDLICEEGQPCTCSSKMLADFRPPYSAHVSDLLLAADAVPTGRANMDEFAMGSSTENSAVKTTKNPWDLERAPGGSSGGSAAAVAAGFTPLAVGTDTGGSIRQPAAFCGITGLKPTYGRVSRYGLVAFASSLDQIGPMATTVADAALMLQAIAGHDARDATCLDEPVPDYLASLDEPLTGLRVGVCREHFVEGLDAEVSKAVLEAVEVYKSLGAEVVDVDLPHSKYSVATYYIIAPSEASSNLARYDGVHYGHRSEKFDPQNEDLVTFYERNRGEGFGDEVKRRILLGTFTLSAGYSDQYYNQSLKVRRLIKRDFVAAFEKCDVIASPATPTAAFKIGELVDDPLAMYLNDMYTIAANMAGIPALSLPCGFTAGGLPIGLQLSAGLLAEEKLLRAARMYEAATDWHTRRPA